MDQFWEDLWKREAEFMANTKSEFRHGVPFVGVSTLAEQFYCEYKVENEFELGEVPTEAKEAGTALHDELIPGEEVSAEDFAELVGRKKPSFAVLRVWGEAAGLRLVGMPDHIVWSERRPLWLVELKTTRGDPTSLWEDQASQVMVYGLLLDLMGFDCSSLRLALVRLKAGELSDDDRRRWVERVSSALMQGRVAELESGHGGAMKVHMLDHDRAGAVAKVADKMGYWTGERDPTSSTSIGKCRACEYRAACPKSLFRPP